MNGAVPLLPLCAFMAWTGKPLPIRSLIVVILFQKYLNAAAQGSIHVFRHATGTHNPIHMHHQLHLWHEEEQQASENLCSHSIKRFEIRFRCFRKAKVTKCACLLPNFCLFAFNNSSADLKKKLHGVWYWEVCRRLEICIQTGQSKGYFVTVNFTSVCPCVIV